MKWSTDGPRACNAVDESVERSMGLTEKRQGKRQQMAAIEMTSKPAREADRQNFLTDLSRAVNRRIQGEHRQKPLFDVHVSADNNSEDATFHVRRHRQEVEDSKIHTCQESKSQSMDEQVKMRSAWCVAQFERTRIVKVKKQHGTLVASCSCELHSRWSHCCRHIHACLIRKPVHTDASVRWWNICECRHLKSDKELTAKLDQLRHGSGLNGVKVEVSDMVKSNIGDKP